MTKLDLAGETPKWSLTSATKNEAIRLLAIRTDSDLVDELADLYRKKPAPHAARIVIEKSA